MKLMKLAIFTIILTVLTVSSFCKDITKISAITKPGKLGILKLKAVRSTPFKLVSFPAFMKGLPYVFVPRGNGRKPGTAFSFTVNKAVVVYIFVLARGGYKPDGWRRTELKASWSANNRAQKDIIYKKSFPAGKVKIPAHDGEIKGKGIFGPGHLAVIQSAASVTKAPEKIKISNLSKGARILQTPNRILMGKINMVIPDIFGGAQFVCMPRGVTNKPGKGFSFKIDRACDVYISVHKRGNAKVKGWEKTNLITYWSLKGNTHKEDVYKKYFKAGKVTIPPNKGTNGRMYAIPHVAIIRSTNKTLKNVFTWNWQQLGYKTVPNELSNNEKPFIKLSKPETIQLKLNLSHLKKNKVYNLYFGSTSNVPQILKISSSPKHPMPFGGIFKVNRFWNKIICPVVISKQNVEKELVFQIKVPAGVCLEAPVLIEDKLGILPHDMQIVKHYPNHKWKTVNMGTSKEVFQEIKAGSALDFSKLPIRIPAGEKGRLIVNQNGRLAFKKEPDVPIRFRAHGFNLRACRTREAIDEYIRRTYRQGYNMIRLHIIVRSFSKRKYARYGVTIDNAEFIPQSADDFKEYFDENKLKLFDYLLAELGKRGIYVYFDIMGAYTGWTDAAQSGHWVGKDLLGQQFHAQLYVNETYRRNWKEGITYLLNRANTVNGIKLKDNPVIACMLFMNEQNFRLKPSFFTAFEPQWKKYYGANAPKLSERLLKSNSNAGLKAGRFMLGKVEEMTDFFHKTIRKAGYKGLVTNWDFYMRMIDAVGREKLQVVSMHSYHGHPGLPIRKHKSVPGYPNSSGSETRINRKSSIIDNGAYLSRIIVMRNINRPSMIMEYGDTPPNPYRHEAGLFFASYAKLNGVDVLMPHGDILAEKFKPLAPFLFSDFSDPIFRASDVINAFAFLRGDVKTAKHNVEFLVTPKILDSANRIDALAVEYAKTFLMTKVGTKYSAGKPLDPVGNVKADLQIVPELFARARGTSVEAAITDNESRRPQIVKDIVANLRKKNILNKKNRTNPDKDIFESETNELLMVPSKGTLQVSTPRLEGAVLKEDKPVQVNVLSIKKCSTPAAVSMISLDAKQELSNSEHMLLLFSTNSVNSGMVTNADGSRLLELGSGPLLMRTGILSLRLKNKHQAKPKVYALNLDGTRAESITATQDKNGLHLNIDTSKLKYATPFFEIVY